jgi:transposase
MSVESFMRLNLDELPYDTALLHQLVRDLVVEKEQRDSEIEKLRLIIRQLQRGQFGRHSERLDPDQLHLGLEDLDADIARAESKQADPRGTTETADRPARLSFPEDLPRDEITLDVEYATCRHCGGGPP